MTRHWTPSEDAKLIYLYANRKFSLRRISYNFGYYGFVGAINSRLYRLRKQNPKLKLLWRNY